MTNRFRPVHSGFESLQAARLLPRLHLYGRPALFATNEQITALGFAGTTRRPGFSLDALYGQR